MATAITYNELQALYLGLFDRPADAGGETYWESNSTSASSTAQSLGGFAQYYSDDKGGAGVAGAAISSSNITGEITNLYTNMLGYTPAANDGGVSYWAGVFNTDITQGMTAGAAIGSIANQIFNIIESLPATSPYINDQKFLNNAIATASSYTAANAHVTYSSSAYLTEGQAIITTPTMTTTNLTTTIDNIAPVGNTNIYGTLGTNSSAAGTGTDTLNPLDTIKATGSNNVLNITDQGYGLNESISTIASNHDFNFASVNVSGVQTLNIQAIYGETDLNVSGWTGLTALNLTASNGADGITAGTGTAVTLTDSKLTIGTTTVSGGSSINATVTGVTTGGAVNIGSSSTAGAITATVTDANTTVASITGSTITVAGGTIDNVTQNIAAAGSGLGTNTSTGGSITVNGGAATTSVSVTQTAPVTAVTGVAAVAQVDTLTYSGTASAGTTDSIIVNGTTYTASGLSTTATSTAVATAVAAAITAPGITVTHSAGVVTLTANVAGTPFTVAAGTDQTGITEVTATTAANVVAVTGVGGIADGTVAVNDANAGSTTAAGTITSVTLDNYGNSTISSNALSNLSLSDKGGTISITDALATPTATTLNLTVNNLSGTDTITDVNNEYKKLSITTGAKASTLTGINATGITSEIIGGSSLLTQTAAGMTNLATIAVNGGAGLTDSDLASISTLTSVTASSNASGIITVALNDTKTTFTGGSGQDIVTITSDATKAITGGSALNNEIVLNGTTFSLADTGTNVTHFSIAGFNSGSTAGSYDVSGDGSSIFGAGVINTIDLQSGFNTATTFTVAPSTALTIDGSITTAQVYEATGNSGLTDHVGITVGASSNATDLTVSALTLEDSASHGIGIVSLTSNDTGGSTGINTITTLTDNGMSALTLNGAGGLTIGTLNDNAATQTITDSGTGAVSITEAASSTLSNLTLSGAVGFILSGDSLTTGVTVAGGADNATVVLSLTGSAATYTDTVTLGNGNSDSVIITAGAGTENITLGNGGTSLANENTVTLTGSTAAADIHVGTGVDAVTVGTGIDDVTFGSHTSTATLHDTLNLSNLSAASFTPPTSASQININASGLDVITGLSANDHIVLPTAAIQYDNAGTLANSTATVIQIESNLAGTVNTSSDAYIDFAHGTYSASAGTFTLYASGPDTLMTYDAVTNSGTTQVNNFVSVVLVGVDVTSSATISTSTVTVH